MLNMGPLFNEIILNLVAEGFRGTAALLLTAANYQPSRYIVDSTASSAMQ